jgi:hypothetical protein
MPRDLVGAAWFLLTLAALDRRLLRYSAADPQMELRVRR